MIERLWIKFPIFLAVFFCLYAYGMIANSLDTYHLLSEQNQSRVIAENAQKAATLGDYLTQEKIFVSQIADGPEINNFLANHALGMSLQYGLQASLDAIAQSFAKTLATRSIDGKPLYTRVVYVDAGGALLVDSDAASSADTLPAAESGLSVDPERAVVQIAAPVFFRGTPAGRVVVWSDLGRLVQFLLPDPAHDPAEFVLSTAEGKVVHVARAASYAIPMHDQLMQAERGKLQSTKNPNKSGELVIIKHPIPGIPLDLTTIAPKESLLGPQHSQTFLLLACLFPPIMLVSTLLFERMRLRNAATEQRLHATRLRLQGIADHLIEGIVLIDGKGVILFINRPALILLGHPDEPQRYVGLPLDQLLQLQNSPDVQTAWHSVIDQGATLIEDDAVFNAATDRQINVAYGCTPLYDTQHGPSIILSFRDISSLKQAQHDSMQSLRLASIGQLAAGIAHEINTPAQYIGDNLAYVQDGMRDMLDYLTTAQAFPQDRMAEWRDEIPLAIKDCQDGIAQIARIVLSMKEFAHPGTVGRVAADLNHALENTLTVSRNAWKHVAEVERHLDPELPLVMCHVEELNQVFINLIMNAVQAIEAQTNQGEMGKIIIESRQDGPDVVISVADTGCGIPPAIKDRIFDPFFTTKDVGKGSGQGLTICRDVVVTKHHGSLTTDNRPGGGAVFIIRLPVADDAAEPKI